MTLTQVERRLHPRLKDMHATRLDTPSTLVHAFLNTARLGIAALAPGVHGLTGRRHKRNRVDRFLGNVGFDCLDVWITIVADRGFGRARLFPVVGRFAMGHVVRVRGRAHVDCPACSGLLEDYPLREGDTVDLGRVAYREDGIAETRLVLHWEGGAEEPVYPATNVARGARRVVRGYAERMQEEESFRDMKSHRYGFALRYPKLTVAGRYERLMVIRAAGVWLFFASGASMSVRPNKGNGNYDLPPPRNLRLEGGRRELAPRGPPHRRPRAPRREPRDSEDGTLHEDRRGHRPPRDQLLEILAHPKRLRAIWSARAKTDKTDAATLAEILRADVVPCAYVPARDYQELRDLTRERAKLVSGRTHAECNVSAMLARDNIEPPSKRLFGPRGRAWLSSLELGFGSGLMMDERLGYERLRFTPRASDARIARRPAALRARRAGVVDRGEVQPRDDVADKRCWMTLRKPVAEVLRQ